MSSSSRLDEMTAALRAFEPRLDDLARARIEARLSSAIDAAPSQGAPSPARRGWRLAGAAALVVAAAAAALLLIDRVRPEPASPPPRAAASPKSAASAAPDSTAGVPKPMLVVYGLAGEAAAALAPQLGKPQTAIVLDAGAVALASIGARARLSLVGPASLRVVALERERIELALDRGALAVDYDRSRGGELLVRGPLARVRVVGTRFGVRVDGVDMRVGVAHGTVEVDAGRELLRLTDGQGWRASASAVTALSPAMKRRLDAHAASLAPPPAAHTLLKVAGTAKRSTAHLGTRLLGEAPIWALVPVDAVDVSLRDVETAARTAQGETAASLYARAEGCLRARDIGCAERELRLLIARFPDSEQAEPALYELAQRAPDCTSAVPRLRRYLARYPGGRFATGARLRLENCATPQR